MFGCVWGVGLFGFVFYSYAPGSSSLALSDARERLRRHHQNEQPPVSTQTAIAAICASDANAAVRAPTVRPQPSCDRIEKKSLIGAATHGADKRLSAGAEPTVEQDEEKEKREARYLFSRSRISLPGLK